MKFNLRKKDYYICPYCFSKHKLNEVNFICSNDPDVCLNARNLKPIVPRSAEDKNEMPESIFCNECGQKTNIKICPTCSTELPYSIGEYDNLIFTVIGTKGAGKSHYIAVLIDKIMNEIASAFDYSFSAVDDATMKRYRNDFYNPVFRRNEIIGVTHSAKTDFSVKQPLIYNLTFRESGFFGMLLKSRMISNTVTITFFDTSGEDLDSEDMMKNVNKYIYNSSGLIFLIDPLQLESVRQRLPENIKLPEQNTEIEDLLSRTANLIRKENGIKVDKPIDIPVAVVFSKMDALESLIDSSSCINYPSSHARNGYFDLSDFEDVNDTIESLIRSFGEENFVNQLSSNFKEYAYFGMTALGCSPEEGKITKLKPHRVEDPFLWLLYKYKFIKGEKKK
ncbi:zinc ribbon domain-containing protein [Clostridium fermenticellae]|uniref:Zinc ribbon domain-containing protein n=1 Tax=Clostridium fermenticellae TaxID=2068654 RepID=A0A386H0Z9_9CLOT|nr:zinc ribbon domain-containing protein [Clostridium fermenticellae]AYD39352.1 zinc ribbon domain-containing protein [Clostridium fermenticellae]